MEDLIYATLIEKFLQIIAPIIMVLYIIAMHEKLKIAKNELQKIREYLESMRFSSNSLDRERNNSHPH